MSGFRSRSTRSSQTHNNKPHALQAKRKTHTFRMEVAECGVPDTNGQKKDLLPRLRKLLHIIDRETPVSPLPPPPPPPPPPLPSIICSPDHKKPSGGKPNPKAENGHLSACVSAEGRSRGPARASDTQRGRDRAHSGFASLR